MADVMERSGGVCLNPETWGHTQALSGEELWVWGLAWVKRVAPGKYEFATKGTRGFAATLEEAQRLVRIAKCSHLKEAEEDTI